MVVLFQKLCCPLFKLCGVLFGGTFADTFDFDYNIGGAILRDDISAFFLNRAKLKAQLTKNLFDNIFKWRSRFGQQSLIIYNLFEIFLFFRKFFLQFFNLTFYLLSLLNHV